MTRGGDSKAEGEGGGRSLYAVCLASFRRGQVVLTSLRSPRVWWPGLLPALTTADGVSAARGLHSIWSLESLSLEHQASQLGGFSLHRGND